MTTELSIRTAIVAELRRRGCYVLVTTGVSMSGTPDLIVCYQGRFIALEVKRPKGHVDPIQRVRGLWAPAARLSLSEETVTCLRCIAWMGR